MSRLQIKDIQIDEITLRNEQSMRAQIKITYLGIKISHIRVMYNADQRVEWVSLPTIRSPKTKKHSACIWLINAEDKIKLDQLILDAYRKKKHSIERGDEYDDAPVEEIDITL